MSLLKRIEQGQGGQGSLPGPSGGGNGKSPGDGSRLSSLQARRESEPITAPRRARILT